MKRVLSILIALLLIFSLAACTGKQSGSDAPSGNDSEVADSTPSSKRASFAESLKEVRAEEAEPEDAEPEEEGLEEDPIEETDEEHAGNPIKDWNSADTEDLDLGAVDGNTYENRFLGIGVELGDDWTFATEEELEIMNGDINIMRGLIEDEDIRELLEESSETIITALFAEREDGYINISLQYEYLGALYGSLLDEEDYLEVASYSIDNAIDAMDVITDYSYEQDTIEFAGAERHAIRIKEVIYGEDLYQTIILMKAGHYMALLTLTGLSEDITDEVAGYFYALD